jgi:hypothetical protein
VDPLNGLRYMGRRMTDPVESLAQRVAERVVDLVARSLDVNALIQRIDLDAIVSRVDVNELVARVDVNELLGKVDIDTLLSRVDVDQLLAGVDVDALISRVDIDQVLARVDVDALVDRLDVNAVARRVDIDGLVTQTDLGAVIAKSSGGVAANALDVARSQAVGLDEFIARWTGRIRRRRYSGPPGPPELLRAADVTATTQAAAGPAVAPGADAGPVQP